jgi:hypothetical protein
LVVSGKVAVTELLLATEGMVLNLASSFTVAICNLNVFPAGKSPDCWNGTLNVLPAQASATDGFPEVDRRDLHSHQRGTDRKTFSTGIGNFCYQIRSGSAWFYLNLMISLVGSVGYAI